MLSHSLENRLKLEQWKYIKYLLLPLSKSSKIKKWLLYIPLQEKTGVL